METLAINKDIFNGKTNAVKSLDLVNMNAEQLKALRSLTSMQLAEITPKKVTAANVLETRKFIAEIMNDLLTLSRVSKEVHRYLKAFDRSEFFTVMLTEKQTATFNENQFNQLCKSPKLVLKFFTESQFQKFVTDGNKCSPSTYLNAIKKGATVKTATFKKVQKG